jgi:hypothetical protein
MADLMKILRDLNGRVEHIGDWDFLVVVDDNGNETINNPMPPGLTESDEEVVMGWDGGLYAYDDPRQYAPL